MRSLSLAVLLVAASTSLAAPPNVLVVITDDQGYGDLGFHNNPVLKTPNLDKFAKESVRLTHFHVSPVCSPTRSSLMSGLYNYRTGVTDTFIGRALMRTNITTLPEKLAAAGYRTGLFGKWHLGDCYPMRPEDRGFQETLWLNGGGLAQPSDAPELEWAKAYFDPILTRNGKETKTKGYCTDVFTDAAMKFISADDKKPFFAYIAYNAPHGPYQVKDEDAAPYRKLQMKVEDFPKIGQPWAGKKLDTAEIANAYGMIANIDDNFAKLMKLLDEKKLAENTLVIFLTDNGPGGVRYNSGLRNRKGTVYDGGIRVPCFVRYPAKFKGDREVDYPAAHIDLMPTILETCDVKPEGEVKYDGMSLFALLAGQKVELVDRNLFFQWHRGDEPEKFRAFAVRGQKYKLVQSNGVAPNAKWDAKYELFDMSADQFEQKDLAADKPEEVAKLKKAYEEWFADVTKAGFAPQRISLGNGKQNPVRLTRQDWRGDKAGWDLESVGHWDVKIEKAGLYKFTMMHPKAFTKYELQYGKEAIKEEFKESVKQTSVTLKLPAGDLRLQAVVGDGKQQWGVRYLVAEYVEK